VGIDVPHGSSVEGASAEQDKDLALAQLRPKRVAIVGAGASGSAAAFFLRRAARIMEERIGAREGAMLGEVVVVDKEGYVGGRESDRGHCSE
jgi:ketol-acid reductoisomerase